MQFHIGSFYLQMLQLFTNQLLNDHLFTLVLNVAVTMQLGYNMEVGAKWYTLVCLFGYSYPSMVRRELHLWSTLIS
jgi:hypothetical protein